MRVRVYDKINHTYYLSELYGFIHLGSNWQYIVQSNKKNERKLCLIDYLDFTTEAPYQVNIERIDCNIDHDKSPWVYLENDKLSEINQMLKNTYHHETLHSFSGYEYIWKQQIKLAELIAHGSILYNEFGNIDINTKLPEWNYIENSRDIDKLIKEFVGFHDSVIREISYISGDYVDENGSMYLTESHEKKIKMIFDSDWSESIEIVFESVRLLQLVPPGENYLAYLLDASIFIRDCMIYFYDTNFNAIPEHYNGTWIKALGMRWRKERR